MRSPAHELRYKGSMGLVVAEFSAPWGRALRLTTALAVALLLGIALLGLLIGARQWRVLWLPTVGLPLGVVLAALPFMVRGYVLTQSDIEIRRLGWNTVLPLAGLSEVKGEPEGLRGSVRLFGNGGLFAISGWFWNRRIGRFRAFATDPQRMVLLRYQDGRKVVVTPHDVQHFIVQARRLAGLDPGQRS
jgi:hypothetical protein